MCPALARGKWPGLSKHLSGVHETERQHRAHRTHRRGEVLSMVLERKIRTVEEVSFETSSANLLDLKGANQLVLFRARFLIMVFVQEVSLAEALLGERPTVSFYI